MIESRTPEGKQQSSLSHFTHGFYATTLHRNLVALNEDPEEYRRMHQGWRESLGPEGAAEETVLEDLVSLEWERRRLSRALSGLQVKAMDELEAERAKQWSDLEHQTLPGDQDQLKAWGLLRQEDSPAKFDGLLRALEKLRELAEWGVGSGGPVPEVRSPESEPSPTAEHRIPNTEPRIPSTGLQTRAPDPEPRIPEFRGSKPPSD